MPDATPRARADRCHPPYRREDADHAPGLAGGQAVVATVTKQDRGRRRSLAGGPDAFRRLPPSQAPARHPEGLISDPCTVSAMMMTMSSAIMIRDQSGYAARK